MPAAQAQSAGVNQAGAEYIHSQAGLQPMPQQGSQEAARVEQMREAERRQHLQAAAARLLDLATQLKTQVDQSARDQLSLQVVRKAEEVEKLARDIKQTAKN